MPRPPRIEIPDGMYYVVHRGSKYGSIFRQSDDYDLFESLLPAVLKRSGALLHAYCWTPEAIHLVVQIERNSVSRFVQRLFSDFARRMNQRLGGRGHFFQDRHNRKLIDPNAYLPSLINYIHYIPVLEGVVLAPDACLHTSHLAYLGLCDVPWLHTKTTMRLLGNGTEGQLGYRNLMSTAPTPDAVKLFKRGDPKTPGVLGSHDFVNDLPRRVRPYRSEITLDEIVAKVACLRGISKEIIFSKSRVRECVVARAMIAWYAIERGVANLNQVARYMRRDPSTLSVAITRYRASRPELFTLTMFHQLTPIAQWPSAIVSNAWGSSRTNGSEDRSERSQERSPPIR